MNILLASYENIITDSQSQLVFWCVDVESKSTQS